MIRLRRKHKKRILILIISLVAFFLVMNWYSDNVLAGENLKVIAPEFYKKDQQSHRLNWFNRLAKEEGKSLHIAAGWSYLTDDQFNGIKFQLTCQIC